MCLNYALQKVLGQNHLGALESSIFHSNTENFLILLKSSFTEWLSLPDWNKINDKEIYISVTLPSYDGSLKNGWIEPDGKYGPEYVSDFKEQAMGYEGLFRSLYSNNFNITGVISYGYWWTDRIYPEVPVLRNDFSHSIRNKDAENVFYKWSMIFSHEI